MKVYKFRAVEQINFVFDIIFKNRLFCANWSDLNDPVEGNFSYSYKSDNNINYENKIRELVNQKKRYKVCSLSRTFDNHLLWAHYASGFKGFAVEVELPDNSNNIKDVNYRGVFAYVDMENYNTPEEMAKNILFSKYNEWKYEQEVRIVQENEWYHLETPVKKIIVGSRIEDSVFEAFKIICKKKNIDLHIIGIGDEGLDADFVDLNNV